MDREKVIKGLEHCLSRYDDGLCDDCTYMGKLDKSYMIPLKCKEIIMRDALVLLKEQETMMQCIKERCRICPHCANCDVDENGLLKEQEAVEPIITDHMVFGTNRKCSKCKRALFPAGKYCPHCGQEVKWE